MGLKNLFDKMAGNIVTREIDGFTFSFRKDKNGKIDQWSSKPVIVKEITQDGLTFQLSVVCNGEDKPLHYYATLIKYAPKSKHIILPYSINYKDREYIYIENKIETPNGELSSFPYDSQIEELTIGCNVGYIGPNVDIKILLIYNKIENIK